MLRLFKLVILSISLALAFGVQAEGNLEPNEVRLSAEQGDAKAQAKLGAMYLLGSNGIEKDEQQAAEWMLKAANQGIIEAQVIMAALYDRGLGVENDVNMATKWYEKAAAQGHEASQAILGKNAIAKGGVAFSYQSMRLSAAKQIPAEYAKRILLTK
jgi:TPR repeat protein